MIIELLENRIAPAAVTIGYTDVDGDLVKITASLPGAALAPLDELDLSFVGGGSSGILAKLDLTDPAFADAKVVFTVTKKPAGDGLAHVGHIDATGVDLNQVIVKGDLGRITVGDSMTEGDPALNLLQARTMGIYGLVTQGGTGGFKSIVTGKLGTLKIAGDMTDAWVDVVAPEDADAALDFVFIGGDLTGGIEVNSGRVSSAGPMGMARVGGDVIGGRGDGTGQLFSTTLIADVRIRGDLVGSFGVYSGQVATFGGLGKIRIDGSIIGGSGQESAFIFGRGSMESVRIGGDVIGGDGLSSGLISLNVAIGDVRIGGSVIGGGGAFSGSVVGFLQMGTVKIGGSVVGGESSSTGRIFSSGTIGDARIGGDVIGGPKTTSGLIAGYSGMGHVWIGGDLIGGNANGADDVSDTGVILSFGRIKSVTIRGSVISGNDNSTGTLVRSGSIASGTDIGPIKIGQDVVGNPTHAVQISARGQAVKPAIGFDTAISSLTIGGRVMYGRILAGFDPFQNPNNADASIGAVFVGKGWLASSLVAGAQDSGLDGFGQNDSLQAFGLPPLVARIASITIKGDVTGSYPDGDVFGFVAQQIDKLKIAGRLVLLTAGPSGDQLQLFPFGDVWVNEV